MATYVRLLEWLDRGTCWAVILAGGVMVFLVAVEVFTRYVLSSSIFFANELARLMFVWMVFLGLPLALVRGRHVGIGLLVAALPRAAARGMARATGLLSALLMAVVLHQSAGLLVDNWDQTLGTLPLSAGVFMLPIPIGAGLTLLHLIRMVLDLDQAPMETDLPAPR